MDEALWNRLVDRLKQVLEDVVDGDGEGTPLDESLSTPVLELTPQDNETILLTWPYCHLADYNQDGQVGMGDLTPLALHFGKTAEATDWEQARIADGDGNGEVNISDVTPIGLNFSSKLGWYHVEEAASAQAQEWILRARVSLVSAQPTASGSLSFALQLSDPKDGYYYRAAPFSGSGGVGLAQPSIPVQFIVPTPVIPTVQATDGEYRDRVELTWTASPWATYYKVYRDAQSPAIAELYHETSWVDHAVWDANEHTYWVRAMNERTQSGYGDGDVGYKAASLPAWGSFNADARHTGRSSAAGPEAADIKWSYSERDVYLPACCVVSAEGTVYIVTHEEYTSFYLTAIGKSGIALWYVKLSDKVNCPPCIGPDGAIYVQALGGALYSIDKSGLKRWVLKLDQHYTYSKSPICTASGIIITSLTEGGDYLLALDPYGQEVWRIPIDGLLTEAPALSLSGVLYLVLSRSGHSGYEYVVQAVALSGVLVWSCKLPDLIRSCPCVADNGALYVACADDNLYAISHEGAIDWYLYIGFRHMLLHSSSPTMGYDGTVYISSKHGFLHALNSDGSEKWTYQLTDTISQENGSAAIDANGVAYYINRHGRLVAIDQDGSLKWQTEQIEWPSASLGPAIGSDGTVYFVESSTLYAVGSSQAE